MEPAQPVNSDDDVVGWFERVAESAGSVQTQTLRRILELNWGVEYLKKCFGDHIEINNVDDSELESLYTTSVPLATHHDFEPFIQRIADGDKAPLLTQQPISALARTSGTSSGKNKYVPLTLDSFRRGHQLGRVANAFKSRAYPTRQGWKVLSFGYCKKQVKTKGGLLVGSASSFFFDDRVFNTGKETKNSNICSPLEVIFGEDYKQSIYCHLLLGLFFSDQVDSITSLYAYSLVQAFSEFEDLWKDLCTDIKQGSLSPTITCPKMRKAVLDIVSPNQNLASRIEANCNELEGSDWYGLVPKIWPNAKYVYTITTGSMRPYLKRLKNYAGDLALVGSIYLCSESCIGTNIDPFSPPENVVYTLLPTLSYFEFIPLRKKESCIISSDEYVDEDHPIPLSKVEVGQEYEIVLTTFSGLYRYKLGDIVEVVGFHKDTPNLNFVRRADAILSVSIEKTSEKELEMVLDKASEMLAKASAEIVDYTSHAEVANQPGHYIIYLEIRGEVEDRVLGECCTEMDVSFEQQTYVILRKSKSIGPLELCILEKGAFKRVVDYFVENGGTFSQFKTPRSTNNQAILGILNASTITRFLSKAYS